MVDTREQQTQLHVQFRALGEKKPRHVWVMDTEANTRVSVAYCVCLFGNLTDLNFDNHYASYAPERHSARS